MRTVTIITRICINCRASKDIFDNTIQSHSVMDVCMIYRGMSGRRYLYIGTKFFLSSETIHLNTSVYRKNPPNRFTKRQEEKYNTVVTILRKMYRSRVKTEVQKIVK